MIKRLGILLALMAIVVAACSSGGSGGATAAPATAASSAAAPSEAAPSEGGPPARLPRPPAATPRSSSSGRTTSAPRPSSRSPQQCGHGQRRHRRGPGDHREHARRSSRPPARQGTGPDIVVWAHDVDRRPRPEQRHRPGPRCPTRRCFDPLAVKGMTFDGQLYGVPVLGREHRPDPQHGPGARLPRRRSRTWSRPARQLVKDKKATKIMALQVGQKGDAYHIYPLFTSGGGSFFGTDRDRRPGPDQRDRRLRRSRSRPARRSSTSARRASARSSAPIDDKNAIPLFTGKQDRRSWSPARGPSRTSRRPSVNYDICADPAVRGRQAGAAVHRRQRLLPRQQGQEQDARPGVRHELRPDPRFPGRRCTQAEPRRPALTAAVDAGQGRPTRTSRSSRTPAANGTILPAIPAMGQVWDPFGMAEAAIVGGADPKTALDGRRQGDPRRHRQAVVDVRRDAAGRPRGSAPAGRRPPDDRATVPARAVGVPEEEPTGTASPPRRAGAWPPAARGAARQDPAARGRRRDRGLRGIPLVASQEWVWLARPGPGHRRRSSSSTSSRWHIPVKYLVPGHDLPDRLPGRPGRRPPSAPRSRTSATATGARKDDAITAIQTSSVNRCRARPSTS